MCSNPISIHIYFYVKYGYSCIDDIGMMKLNIELVINNLRNCRKQQNMSQEELAEKAGLSKNYISELERHEKSPSLETFIKLANALGASADVLLEDVLVNGYKTHTSLLADKLEDLPPKKQREIMAVVDIMIKFNK